ncbi:hypothetical protein AYI68_g4739 [Smittium mucronatum]|uniref:Uncharacterized protein n=1 Tax=Smittium mucronatum TaxID=133383 RepID=A0A1R0GW93_9FUNG|nr:hypothetical protein AYI68_g4739 [Smittium mucronatum]
MFKILNFNVWDLKNSRGEPNYYRILANPAADKNGGRLLKIPPQDQINSDDSEIVIQIELNDFPYDSI